MAVAVSDGGGPTVPMVNEPTNWSIGGRGLGIVARLSLRWGVCVDDEHWESDQPDDGLPDQADGHTNGQADGQAINGHSADENGGCPNGRGPGETTVWAELPVRYGSPTGPIMVMSAGVPRE